MAETSIDMHKETVTPDGVRGTEHNPWRSGFGSGDSFVTTNTTAFGNDQDKAATATKPATNATTGRCVFAPGERDHVRLRFFGTDAADETINYRTWKWRWCPDFQVWVPTLLCKGVVTLGSGAFAGVTSGLWAGIITADEDMAVGSVKLLDAATPDNIPAEIQIDFDGAPLVEVEFDLGTAAAAGFLWYTL